MTSFIEFLANCVLIVAAICSAVMSCWLLIVGAMTSIERIHAKKPNKTDAEYLKDLGVKANEIR